MALHLYGDSVASAIAKALEDQQGPSIRHLAEPGIHSEGFLETLRRYHREWCKNQGGAVDDGGVPVLHIGANDWKLPTHQNVSTIVSILNTMYTSKVVVLIPTAKANFNENVTSKIEAAATALSDLPQNSGLRLHLVSIARMLEPDSKGFVTGDHYTDYHPTDACICHHVVPALKAIARMNESVSTRMSATGVPLTKDRILRLMRLDQHFSCEDGKTLQYRMCTSQGADTAMANVLKWRPPDDCVVSIIRRRKCTSKKVDDVYFTVGGTTYRSVAELRRELPNVRSWHNIL